jgi:hypothetical protein
MTLRHLVITLSAALSLTLVACNDKPTDTGSSIIVGTDTLYVTTTKAQPLLDSSWTQPERVAIFNNTYSLLGTTGTSDARLFVNMVNWPSSYRNTDSFDVISADLRMIAQPYAFGDTTSRSMSFNAYEITQVWSPTATWDSLYLPDGTSPYYSLSSTPLATFSADTVKTDSTLSVPITPSIVEKWLVMASDTTTRQQIFGMALHPLTGTVIRQFRTVSNSTAQILLRCIVKHIDSTDADTFSLQTIVGCYVNTPEAQTGELLTQGARLHKVGMHVNLAHLPSNAVVLAGTMSVKLDNARSQFGTYGVDEVIRLDYVRRSTSTPISYYARYDSTSARYTFRGMATLMQDVIKHGGTGSITIVPDGVSEFWRMNRQRFFSADADSLDRPTMQVIYTVPEETP